MSAAKGEGPGRASSWYLKRAFGKPWSYQRPAMSTRSYVDAVLRRKIPAAPSSAESPRSRGRLVAQATQKAPKSPIAAVLKRASAVAPSSKLPSSSLRGASSGKRMAAASPLGQNSKQRTKQVANTPIKKGFGLLGAARNRWKKEFKGACDC